MRSYLLKLSTILVIALAILGLTGCKKDKYQYPSQIPTLSNPNGTYLTIGESTITNERIYRRMLANQGLDRFNDWLDEQILSEITIDDEEFTAFKNRLIYGVSDLSEFTGDLEETLTRHTNNMIASGYFTEDARNKYYELEYRRFAFAKTKLLEEIASRDEDEPYFSEATIKSTYNSTYRPTVTTIILSFTSIAEAKKLLQNHGVDIFRTSPLGWYKQESSNLFEEEEVKQLFIDMFNEQYAYKNNGDDILTSGNGYTVEDGKIIFNLTNDINEHVQFVYTYKELSSVSSTIATRVFNELKLGEGFHKSFTTDTFLYLNNFFLALKVAESTVPTLEEVRDKIVDQLVNQTLSEDLIRYHLYVEREKANVQIYDEALESLFVQNYNDTFNAQQITDYKKYNKTTGESKSIVAEITVNGTKKTLTPDEFFNILKNMHGVQTSIDYMNQYIVLSNEAYAKIYNPFTDTIVNQEKYQELFDKNVKKYQDELSKGTFVSIGMPSNYGWSNFLRDYFGIMSDKELLINAALYSEALNLFTKDQYSLDDSDPERSITAQMEKIYQEFFNIKSFSLHAFYDYNLDTVADDPEEWTTEQNEKAEAFLDKVFEQAALSTKKTIKERLTEVVTAYKLAGLDDETWGEFKKAGLRLNITTEGTYTAASTLHENYKSTLKAIWNQLKEEELVGELLDTSANPARVSDYYKTTTGLNRAVILNSKDAVYIDSSPENLKIYPDEDLIELYTVYKKPDEEKTNEELNMRKPTPKELEAIDTYYLPAIKTLEAASRIDKILVSIRAQMISDNLLKFASEIDNQNYQTLLEAYQALNK
jgi:hypothetical protein